VRQVLERFFFLEMGRWLDTPTPTPTSCNVACCCRTAFLFFFFLGRGGLDWTGPEKGLLFYFCNFSMPTNSGLLIAPSMPTYGMVW